MKTSPTRTAAYEILLKIEAERAYSSALLPLFEARLDPVDRGLCHEIVLGVLRRKLLLDRYIDRLTKGRKLDDEVRNILRIGLFQIYFLDRIPDHAAVNESVLLAHKARKSSAGGLVNAVLRAAIRQRPTLEFENKIDRLAVESSHPEWLIQHWLRDQDFEQVEKLVHANNETPPIAFRRTIRGKEVRIPGDMTESATVPGCFIAGSFDEGLRELAERGEIYFQDEAAQMVAAAVTLGSGEKFLDVCAAPGGKTTAIAYRSSNAMQIVAGDLTWRRVQLLNDTCVVQGSDFVHLVQYDATNVLPFAENLFDWVLVDAPCTGTGTIRHNPEIRYFLDSGDFARIQLTQLAIICNSAKLVRPGGKLVYSTCSLERDENENVCAKFLSVDPGWRLVEPSVPKKFWTGEGYARTFPHRDRLDGFFIATFQRSLDTKNQIVPPGQKC